MPRFAMDTLIEADFLNLNPVPFEVLPARLLRHRPRWRLIPAGIRIAREVLPDFENREHPAHVNGAVRSVTAHHCDAVFWGSHLLRMIAHSAHGHLLWMIARLAHVHLLGTVAHPTRDHVLGVIAHFAHGHLHVAHMAHARLHLAHLAHASRSHRHVVRNERLDRSL